MPNKSAESRGEEGAGFSPSAADLCRFQARRPVNNGTAVTRL